VPDVPVPDVAVTAARMQFVMAGRPAAGYFTLKNQGQTQLSLTGASAPDCGSLMMHRSTSQGGMSRMEMVDSIRIPPGGTAQFAPGGYHLMCMEPRGALLSGKGTEPVTLQFAGGARVEAPFVITGPNSGSGAGSGPGSGPGSGR
jgi:copper(I)-binding protein